MPCGKEGWMSDCGFYKEFKPLSFPAKHFLSYLCFNFYSYALELTLQKRLQLGYY